jgi:hypothetical protein
MRLIEKTASTLENTHMNTRMPPSLHISAEVRRKKQRSPTLVHGTLYRERRVEYMGEELPSLEFLEHFGLRRFATKSVFANTGREEGGSEPVREGMVPVEGVEVEKTLDSLDVYREGPHLRARAQSAMAQRPEEVTEKEEEQPQ